MSDPHKLQEPAKPAKPAAEPDPLAPVGKPAATEAEVLLGGPGQSESAVEVKVGERTFLVEPEIAAALSAGGQPAPVTPAPAATPAATPAEPAPAPAPAPAGETLESYIAGGPIAGGPVGEPANVDAENEAFQQRLWDNPLAVFNEAKDAIKKEMRAEAKAASTMQTNTAAFWNDFYTANKDLTRDDQLIIDGIVTRHYNEVIKLAPPAAQTRIAELSREELLRIRGGSPAPKKGETPVPRTVLESGSGGGSITPAPPAEGERDEETGARPGTLTHQLKQRAAKRAAAG